MLDLVFLLVKFTLAKKVVDGLIVLNTHGGQFMQPGAIQHVQSQGTGPPFYMSNLCS